MQKFQEYTTGPYKKPPVPTESPEQVQVPNSTVQKSDPWSNVSSWNAFLGGLRNPKLKSNEWIQQNMSFPQWMRYRYPTKDIKTLQKTNIKEFDKLRYEYKQMQEQLRRKNTNWLQRVLAPIMPKMR